MGAARPTHFLSIAELGTGYRAGALSPVAVTRQALDRIGAFDRTLNSFITVCADESLAQAATAERELAGGHDKGPLHGAPVAVKDLIDVAGVPTTYASRADSPRRPSTDAVLVRGLRAAGAVILGKTNLLEYAYGAVHPDFGQTNNPWDAKRTSGGSSGGSAAAVAAGFCFAAVGTDTGGSIRIPASYCGIVGLKPTYGLVDLEGVQALSWSLDHAGPLARSCADAGLLLEAMSGRSCRVAPAPLAGLRLGVMTHPGAERYLQPAVVEAMERVTERLTAGGALVRGVSVADLELAADALLTILSPEASVVHQRRIAEQPQGFGEATRQQIEAGFAVPATAYVRAQQLRRALVARFRTLFSEVDALLSPAVPWEAPAEDPALNDEAGAGEMLYSGVYNLVGLPAASVPCGLSSAGMPMGLQIVGPWRADARVLSIGAAVEGLAAPVHPPL
jgi:aspartyl-tRNA(Asn)/glutamyl-tRNA(Gln) amidotransferase subunit A